jgi:hypothetical protein
LLALLLALYLPNTFKSIPCNRHQNLEPFVFNNLDRSRSWTCLIFENKGVAITRVGHFKIHVAILPDYRHQLDHDQKQQDSLEIVVVAARFDKHTFCVT